MSMMDEYIPYKETTDSKKDRQASVFDQMADAIDADVLHITHRAKIALRRLNAAIARQEDREGWLDIGIVDP